MEVLANPSYEDVVDVRMKAQTEIEQAWLDQIGKIQKEWNEREIRLTKLVEDASAEEKEREERLTVLVDTLFNKVNGLTMQFQSAHKLVKHLEQLKKLLEDG